MGSNPIRLVGCKSHAPSIFGGLAMFKLHHGNCLDVLKAFPDDSVDSIVTDPPYGLSFMGKKWDYDVPAQEIWEECLRVLKPGGHLLAFAGTRTQHRMAVRIEDAGFEIRDMIAWVYGSGFPKSHNLDGDKQGWGTALKPALEPITVARKPLIGTVADNVMQHGTGALNIDGCRIVTDPKIDDPRLGGNGSWKTDKAATNVYEGGYAGEDIKSSPLGRWPANFIHDGSDEATELLNDSARFFYCAKANKRDRDEGLDGFDDKKMGFSNGAQIHGEGYDKGQEIGLNRVISRKNNHPTVKPTDLMRYLCRLVTPPSGVVLDPFMGSGSTGKAAMMEGFQFIGIEREHDYISIAEARISDVIKEKQLKLL